MDFNDATIKADEMAGEIASGNDAYPVKGQDVYNFNHQLEGRSGVLPIAIAFFSTGLFLGSFLTKRAPVSLIISSGT